MSAYKKLNKQDVYVTAYTARKSWEASGSLLTDYGIEVARGFSGSLQAYLDPYFYRDNAPFTWIEPRYEHITYRGIRQLYYSNEFTEVLDQSASYDNYYQSSFTVGTRNLGNEIGVVSIPREITGTHLQPSTVVLDAIQEDIDNYVWYDEAEDAASYGLAPNYPTDYFTCDSISGEPEYVESIYSLYGSIDRIDCLDYIVEEEDYVDESLEQYTDVIQGQHTTALQDNGEGVLVFSGSIGNDCADDSLLGNTIYTHGQNIITDEVIARYFTTYLRPKVDWKSNQPIYTYNVHCKVKDSEMNFTLNPTAISGSNGDIQSNINTVEFEPYVTTVGLYNDAGELLAVAKLGQPIPKSSKTDMTFVVKIDI